MDFITGSLPNVMFLVGILAVGVGLGLEFKIIELKGTLSRSSRLGALGIGGVLIAMSVILYTRPAPSTDVPDAGVPVQASLGAPLMAGEVPTASAAPSAPPTAAPSGGDAAPPADPPTAPAVAPSTTDEPFAALRAQLAASSLDRKLHAELLKHVAEVEGKLAEGKAKDAGDKLRDLDKKLREAIEKDDLSEAQGAQLRATASSIATAYGLDAAADEDEDEDD